MTDLSQVTEMKPGNAAFRKFSTGLFTEIGDKFHRIDLDIFIDIRASDR